MSEINSDLVKRGFWIDWSQGRVLGATITTDTASANVLIALLVILVTLAGDHLWNLVLFIIHQCRAARKDGDPVFQQEQAILRSLPTPVSLITDLTKILWTWRAYGRSAWRMISILSFVLLFCMGTLVAGLFCSKVIKLGNVTVLVSGNSCVVDVDMNLYATEITPWTSDLAAQGLLYSQNCYGSHFTPTSCNIYVPSRIPLSQTYIPCPAPSSDICFGSNNSAITIDSGFLHSGEMLGMNDHPNNQVLFRKQTQYFPARVDNRWTMLNSSAPVLKSRPPLPGEEWFSWNFGRVKARNIDPSVNATIYYSTYQSNMTWDYTFMSPVKYQTWQSLPLEPQNVIPELDVNDANIGLGFIASNAMASRKPINDPIFSSHRAHYCNDYHSQCKDKPDSVSNVTWYHADNPFGVLIGYQRYQACIPDASGAPLKCTDLKGILRDNYNELKPFANDAQLAKIQFLSTLALVYDLNMGLSTPRSVLKAAQMVSGGTVSGLPDNHWVTEAFTLESWVWSTLQIAISTHGIGWSNDTTALISPQTATQSQFCNSQKVFKVGGFANINVFGLSFIIAVSGFIIVADLCLLKIVIFLSKSKEALCPRVHRWVQDGVLQLQRRAYEGEGFGPWEKVADEIPVYVGPEKALPTFFMPQGLEIPQKTPVVGDDLNFINNFSVSFSNHKANGIAVVM